DPFEGAFPETQTPLNRVLELLPSHLTANAVTINLHAGLDRSWEATRQWIHVSCWHCAEHESAAMWQLYGRSNEAIAVRSTPRRLRRLVPQSPFITPPTEGHVPLHVGMIDYIDYDKDRIPPDFVTRAFRKRKSFEHERELRAVFLDFPPSFTNEMVADHRGRTVAVEPSDLIDAVFIAPQAAPWFADLVRKTAERHVLSVSVPPVSG
ncbi:MAG TPA: hypothetical protein VK636_16910, partial [Gemmatimonadaceae bacterium]|nr:hypothetical protein [Gemmatimonadaceae bacterium]